MEIILFLCYNQRNENRFSFNSIYKKAEVDELGKKICISVY